MTTRAPKRDTLYQRLREVLGNDQAATPWSFCQNTEIV